jgi:sigma-B regulation protein RsbU (phosphoserine phosphatase)
MLASEGFRAHTIVPLAVDGRAVGVLMLDSRQPRSFADDDIRLLQLIANQGAMAIEKARLHAEEVARQQLERELTVARRIQLGLLPRNTPRLEGWEFGVDYEAARHVGGDFYDVFAIPGDSREYGIVIADVADKGIPAALIMAASRTMMRAIAVDGRTPSAALQIANRLVLEESYAGLFVTALFAKLDPDSGSFTFANAGHPRPLRVSSGGQIQEIASAGIALGVVEDIAPEEVRITLDPGDVVVLYTDGVTDAMNAAGDSFGTWGLRDAIANAVRAGGAGHTGPQAIAQAVRAAVDAHLAGSDQTDDLALLAVGRLQEAA